MQDLHAFLLNLQARGEGKSPPLTPKWKDNSFFLITTISV